VERSTGRSLGHGLWNAYVTYGELVLYIMFIDKEIETLIRDATHAKKPPSIKPLHMTACGTLGLLPPDLRYAQMQYVASSNMKFDVTTERALVCVLCP
jgi:hypothetical protein